MFTIYYKGQYINGYCDKDVCRIVGIQLMFKSLHAAKCFITKHTLNRSMLINF